MSGKGIRLFDLALRELESSGQGFSAPNGFQEYAVRAGFDRERTAAKISVDSLDSLAPELKEANTMVFRLGSPPGSKTTRFALAKHLSGWTDYFLFDERIFSSLSIESFIPTVPVSALYAFDLLPSFTESSVVNLALASGLLGHALRLDHGFLPSAPATGQTTYSFPVRPHTGLAVEWAHERGQVEIDALFVARRAGRDTVFLVEAKTSPKFSTLAKHKLVYPLRALNAEVPHYVDICPVYLRVLKSDRALHFYVAVCSFPRTADSALNELEVIEATGCSLVGRAFR